MDYYFSHFPVLETERLILRAKTATDAEDMKTYMADENLYKYWGRNMTRQEREPSLFFGRTLNNGKKDHISWGIELKKNHRLAGEVNLFNIENDRQAMIGYRISAAYQNMGFVTEALRRVIRFCFEETGVQRLEAEVMTVNVASNRVMEKCGFTCEGTKRQAKFVNIYYRLQYLWASQKRYYGRACGFYIRHKNNGRKIWSSVRFVLFCISLSAYSFERLSY